MSVLIVAEHDNKKINPTTLCTVAAARALSSEVCLLIAGSGSESVAQSGAKIAH